MYTPKPYWPHNYLLLLYEFAWSKEKDAECFDQVVV